MKSKICIIASDFYPKITNKLIEGAISKLKVKKIYSYQLIKVPGTFEIPVVLSNLINKYDAFILLGCVIKGETPHFNYLCSSVFESIINISVEFKKPVANGTLTCENRKQAIKRADPQKIDKGGNAANAAISLLRIIK